MDEDYTQQARDYLNIYWDANKNSITDRLGFLLEEFEDMPDYVGPADIWYYFEEARHTFMMGDFIGSVILSACTIELWMSHLLKIPYFQPRGSSKEFDEYTFKKLVDSCLSKGLLEENEQKLLYELNDLRTFYVHGKDIAKSLENKRESKKRSKFWGSKVIQKRYEVNSAEKDAQKAIRILFQFYKDHHWSKQL